MLQHAPRFDVNAAQQIAREHFALGSGADPLTSERDQNFLILGDNDERAILKIANAHETRDMLEAQQAALAHLSAFALPTPSVIPSMNGKTLTEVTGADGRTHLMWAITHLPGTPLSGVTHRTAALLENFGASIGALASGLASFDHPAIHREFHWDLARGREVVARHRLLIADRELGETIDVLMARFDRETAPRLASLRQSAIHNDLNDNNVLVGNDATRKFEQQFVVGIVDFGDMVHGYTVSDLAIAAAYVCLGSRDPLADIANLVRGHHSVFPLTEAELSCLYGLLTLRLCTSACVAAWQRAQNPANAYLDVSQVAIRHVLPHMARIPCRLPEVVFRDACGLAPVAASARVQQWLASNTARFAPVVDADLRVERSTVLDLGIGSALVSGNDEENTEPFLTPRIAELLKQNGTRFGIGNYDEPRLLYTAPFFVASALPNAERRTVHIGLDLFANAGTPVFAPLDGVVHAFAENALTQDYGPVIVLRHVTDDGTEFFTLYGHLSRESLDGLFNGKPIAKGEQFATFGTPDVNVGWTPHLHLQIITDTLDLGTDFPGVAPASQRNAWRSLSPDPNLIVGIPAENFAPRAADNALTLAKRREFIGGNLSIAYRNPVRTLRGWRQYLYDEDGRRYIDAYNNVPHVGHCHPRVVEAAHRQMTVLNTNTRYLNEQLGQYAERLANTLPDPLSVCYLLNSASEANELAVRLAREHTKQRDMIVLEAAYHGNTNTLIDLSPYKHAGPGGNGAPDWVHVAPLPDDYRGKFKRGDVNAGQGYAEQVRELVAEVLTKKRTLAGFIAETCPSVGGQLMLPAGYLDAVYREVRAVGGVCIADEVQTGLGRMGTHFWAFEAHNVVPDIVVMGKPLGNGHPLAAVVTTREIANAFDNGMEFFSTFGGNNVSCAVGLAVLDVLRDEGLQEHALRVGERMLKALRPLVDRYPIVGDVRGSGLFLGVELVRDRETLEPAGAEASHVANRMREEGILLGTDGPHHNVVKIRPPMPFNDSDADQLVEAFERIIGELSV